MANVKITELTNLTDPSTNDVMPVVDVDAGVTKKVSVGEVVGKITGDVEVATDGTATISELPVSKLKDGAARQLLQTAANGTDVEWTDYVDLLGTLDVTGITTLDDALNVAGLATFSEHVDIASAKEFRIAGTKVLDATSLGSAVVSSSLTSVGTLTSGELGAGFTAVATGQGGTGQTTYADGELLIGKTDGTLARATLTGGTGVDVTNADGSVTVAIDSTVVTTSDTGTVTSAMILDGTIVNDDIDPSAAIADTKLDTISTAGKVSNSATTATDANTASAIVARDASGDFSAGTITAASFIPTSSTVPTNGVYLPAANQLALATNGAQALYINADGDILVADGNRMEIDEIRARDGAGLKLFDDAGAGIFIKDGGNVGVGTSSPSQLLHLGGQTNPTIRINTTQADDAWSTIASYGGIEFFSPDYEYGGNGEMASIRVGVSTIFGNLPNLRFFVSSTPGGSANPQERMRITAAGNVGINTTTPDGKLDVNGSVLITEGNELAWHNGSGVKSARIYATSGDELRFDLGSAASRAMTIDSSGRLLVGTSSTTRGGAGDITAQGSSVGAGLRLQTSLTSPADGAGLGYIYYADAGRIESATISAHRDGGTWTSGSSQPTRLVFSTTADGASSPTERMRISHRGDTSFYTDHTNVHIARSGNAAGTTDSIYVGVRSATDNTSGTVVYRVYTNGTYATISDANQKKNIETTRDGYLEDLNKLRVVKYNWNEQADSEYKELGLIAQEVEEVFPGLVTKISESSEKNEFKGIKTSVLPYMLLKALQEATTRIETLEAEVAALKAS